MGRFLALPARTVFVGAAVMCSAPAVLGQTTTTVVRQAALPISAPTNAAITGTGVILGQVVDADTNRPIAGAVVTLGGSPATAPMASTFGTPGPAPTVLTNAQGHFIFRDLPKSSFTLSAQATGYLPTSFGQRRPDGGPARSIEIAEGQRVIDAVIRAWKVGVITGRVVDETGEPLVGVQVRVLRRDASGRLNTGQTQNTDDRGAYRFGGLVPGDYVALVNNTFAAVPNALVESLGGPNASFNLPMSRDGVSSLTIGLAGVGSNMRFGDMQVPGGGLASVALSPNLSGNRVRAYPTTFHPSATSSEDAAIVRLASAQERDGVDIAMKLMTMFSVSGTVNGPSGPMPSMGLRLMPAFGASLSFDNNFEVAVTATKPDGQFTFLGVPPGQYEIRAMRTPQTIAAPTTMTMINTATGSMGMATAGGLPRLTDDPTLWATTAVSVSTADVSGVTLTLQHGTRLRGRVVFEGAPAPPPAADRTRLAINLVPASDRLTQSPQPGAIEEDLTFRTAEYPPGRYLINVTGAPAGWTAVDARVGAANAMTEAFTLDGSIPDDVLITLTNKQTKLSGTVKGSGPGDPNAVVVIFPFEHRAWIEAGMPARLARTADVRSNGAFDVSNLLPGAYAVAAVPASVAVDVRNAQQIEAIARGAVRVVLAVGEEKLQALTITSVR